MFDGATKGAGAVAKGSALCWPGHLSTGPTGPRGGSVFAPHLLTGSEARRSIFLCKFTVKKIEVV